ELRTPGVGLLRLCELLAIDDVHRSFWTHDRDLRARPRDVVVTAKMLARHDVVGPAVRLARDDRELRHGRFGVRVQELRAVADDPGVLRHGAGQKTGDVDERDERYVEGVAEADESRRFDGRVDVEDSGE